MVDRPIMNKSIFDVLFDSVVGIAEKAGSMAMSAAEGLGEGITAAAGEVFGRVSSVSLGNSVSSSEASPSLVQAPQQEVAPTKASAYDVSLAELGSFSAPFGGQSVGGVGIGGR